MTINPVTQEVKTGEFYVCGMLGPPELLSEHLYQKERQKG